MMAAIAIALAFQFPLNDLWHSSTFQIDAHVQAADAAVAVVPDGATVQTTLGLLAPLAARTDTFWIGTAGNPLTQYVVFDNDDSGYSPAADRRARLHRRASRITATSRSSNATTCTNSPPHLTSRRRGAQRGAHCGRRDRAAALGLREW